MKCIMEIRDKCGRFKSDRMVCHKLQDHLEWCINPLDSKNHPLQIANIASRATNRENTINVEYSLEILSSSEPSKKACLEVSSLSWYF